MEEAAMKVIDTLTQEDFNGAFQKVLERYNKCIAAGGDYFCYEIAEGFWFMPLSLVRLRTFRLSTWVVWV